MYHLAGMNIPKINTSLFCLKRILRTPLGLPLFSWTTTSTVPFIYQVFNSLYI